ncbi:MAG: helix-turn-helix domain-containing protein [Chloroflexota bacterium]|nr:helix-turn-helix domain-containing protein [Chloroflexota bacterium]
MTQPKGNSAGVAGSLARFVKDRRLELGLSQAQLEARAGLPPRVVSNIETGRSTLPLPEHRRRLARALGTSHGELLVLAGELTRAEIVEAAGSYGVGRSGPAEPRPRWVEEMADRLADEFETSPRAGLVQAAILATWQESRCLRATFDNLPASEASECRRDMPWEEYKAWRDEQDVVPAVVEEL